MRLLVTGLKVSVGWYLLNLCGIICFPNNPWFLRVCITNLLKALWEKVKLLEGAISPFRTVFSTVLGNFLPFSSNMKLASANSFSLKFCHMVKGKSPSN